MYDNHDDTKNVYNCGNDPKCDEERVPGRVGEDHRHRITQPSAPDRPSWEGNMRHSEPLRGLT